VAQLTIAPDEAARVAGIGRTTLYRAISTGELKSLKIGKRRLIAVETLRTWLLSHEVAS
jgi:excisionase family DNA binding protein